MIYPMHTWTCGCEYKHVDAPPGLRCACGRTWDMGAASADELADYYRRVCGDSTDMAQRTAASVVRLREEATVSDDAIERWAAMARDAEPIPCTHCGGAGEDIDTDYPCTWCDGAGDLTRRGLDDKGFV